MSKQIKKVILVLAVLCLMFCSLSMVLFNTAKADEPKSSMLSSVKIKRSLDNKYLLIATAIKDVDDIYTKISEVGYDISVSEGSVEKTFAENNKYYTSINSGEYTWTASDIFGKDFENSGMIVWEIKYNPFLTYNITPYIYVGENVSGSIQNPEKQIGDAKNVSTKFDVAKTSDTELTIDTNADFDSIQLYIDGVKVADDIKDDIKNGVYDLSETYLVEDCYIKVKLVAVKDGKPLFTSSEFMFEHLTDGVKLGYNPTGTEPYDGNKDVCKAIGISIDNSKFDNSDSTTEWVNVTMDIKGTIGKNSQGESATGGMYIRAYDWGVANGKIDGDLPIFSGASSWIDAYSKTDWTTITIRAPKKATTGGIYLVPFSWPTGFSITVFAKNIEVDYDTISSSSANPIKTAYNANGQQHTHTSNATGCSAIMVSLDTSKFDKDNSTIEYVSVSMKLKGSIEGNLSEGAVGYLDVSTWAVGNGYVASDNYIYSGDTKNIIEILSSSTWKEVTLRLPVKYNYGSVCFSVFIYPGYNVNTLQAKDIVVDYSTVSSVFV